MGFRFYRRINLGNGAGLNVSKSGISSSIRTKWGSFGSKGFSIRTGIPGLSYRGGGKNTGLVLLAIVVISGALLIAFNLIRLLIYLIGLILASIFKEDGIDYKNLVIVLVTGSALSLFVYYNFPISKSEAPAEPVSGIYTPPVMTDTIASVIEPPKPEIKKRKSRKKKNKVIPVIADTTTKKIESPDEHELKVPEPVQLEELKVAPDSVLDKPDQQMNIDNNYKPETKIRKKWWKRKKKSETTVDSIPKIPELPKN